MASSRYSNEVEIKISAALIALTYFSVFRAFNRFFGCRSSLPPHQPPPAAIVGSVNWFKSAGIRERYFPHLSHLIYFFIPVLVSILKYLAESLLATTATFWTVHFSLPGEEYSNLVALSASTVVIEISTDLIVFTYFSVFLSGSGFSTGTVSILSGPQNSFWSPLPSIYVDKRVWVWVLCQNF